MPDIGTRHSFTADIGLAAQARIADPDLSDELPAEMADLDMQPGTVVTVIGHDDERDLVLVEWRDRSSTTRLTSIRPDEFGDNFTPTED